MICSHPVRSSLVSARMTTITSRQHPLVQAFRRVARGDRSLALLDGWHLVEDAAAADLAFDTVAIHDPTLNSRRRELIDQLAQSGARIVQVSGPVLEALSPVRTPTGVVALARRPDITPAAIVEPAPALVVLAIGMQDPGNVGATLRAAEAGAATGAIFAGESADPFGWKALRAAMGSTFRLPTLRAADPLGACVALSQHGVRLLSATPRGGRPMGDLDLTGPVAFLLGGEGPGLPDELTEAADAGITIPMQPPVESLNVAVAAALLVYEARRQRRSLMPEPHPGLI